METGMVIGLIAGLLGAGAGLFFAFYALGFFQYLGGKKPNPNAVNKETLEKALLALNDPQKPYHLVPGEDTDLVAEWKIVDASWYGIFSKNRLSKAYRARLLLDEERHSVRCFELLGSVSWTAGTDGLSPSINFSKSSFGGRVFSEKSYGLGYGIKDPRSLEVGKVYEYKFDVNEIRAPIIATVKANGWEWVPVTVKRHAVYKNKPPQVSFKKQETVSGCLNCGAPLLPQAKFCPACGKPIATTPEAISPSQQAGSSRRWVPWILVGSGLFIIVFLVILVFNWGMRSDLPTQSSKTVASQPPSSTGQPSPGGKPNTEIIEPSPTKPFIDADASDRFNEEGLKQAQAGRFAEGVELFNKAIKADPSNAKAWNNLGLSYRKLNKIDVAVNAYRRAIQAQPDFALAYKNLGIVLEQSGDKAGAAQAYQKYCQLNPSAPDISAVRERAEQLRK